MLRRDAFASIADFNTDAVVTVPTGANGDRALRFNGVAGIDQQVHENLVKL